MWLLGVQVVKVVVGGVAVEGKLHVERGYSLAGMEEGIHVVR